MAERAVESALASLRGNDEAEIDIWGARLEDRLPGRLREALVIEFLSKFGFAASYRGTVKEIVDDCFSVLPKSCTSLRKAMAFSKLSVHESFSSSAVGRLVSKMLEVLKERNGRLRAHERVWASWQSIADKLEQFESGSSLSDVEKQEKRDLAAYVASGFFRMGPSLPAASKVQALGRKFPNFAKVVDYLAGQIALARMQGDAGGSFSPILLLGAPGTGKTLFAQALAKCLATDVHTFSVSSQSSGFSLAGLDRGWSTARPGAVFNALLHGGSLAPVVVLDELDKASVDSRTNPLGALYSLLEGHSAAKFVDEYAGFCIDASSVVWVATANDKSLIPEALLSRFVVFDIEAPTSDQMASLANEIYRQSVRNLPVSPTVLPSTWLQRLVSRTPREVRLAIQQALGRAALRTPGASMLTLCAADFVDCDTLVCKPVEKTFGFGFMSNRL